MNDANAIFMVEGGLALELVKQHIAEAQRVRDEVIAMCRELGVERVSTSREDGKLLGVVFPRGTPVHPDFRKPNAQGVSYPRRGSAWAKRMDAAKGYEAPERVISKAFDIPLTLSYKDSKMEGSRCLGNMLTACGWLYLTKDGPYAMWCPDVPAAVAAHEADGHEVEEPAKSFKLEFDGCRRIEEEEWEILVQQHKLEKKRAAAKSAEACAA